MSIKFVHVNIISKDWRKLADFYTRVFECKPLWPERNLNGKWLDQATSLKNANIEGIHLRLPGFEERSPTLEIFQYKENKASHEKSVNTEGIGHLAFRVDDVEKIINKILENGGKQIGEITTKEIKDVGTITFAYTSDPEGNIIEIQNWS